MVVFVPLAVILVFFSFLRETGDLVQALLSVSLALGLNGLITDVGKLIVGMFSLACCFSYSRGNVFHC